MESDEIPGRVGLFFLIIRRPPRSTQSRSSAASDVYKRQALDIGQRILAMDQRINSELSIRMLTYDGYRIPLELSLIHISEPTRLLSISYAVFCLKKKLIEFSSSF